MSASSTPFWISRPVGPTDPFVGRSVARQRVVGGGGFGEEFSLNTGKNIVEMVIQSINAAVTIFIQSGILCHRRIIFSEDPTGDSSGFLVPCFDGGVG